MTAENNQNNKYLAAANRIEEIDIVRGIAITFVIIGHLVWAEGFLYRFIYSFHMPVFFLLSGYCSKLHKKEINFIPYIIRHIKTLLIPCFIFKIIQIVTKIYVVGSFKETVTMLFCSPIAEWFCPVLFFSDILLWCWHLIITKLNTLVKSKICTLLLFMTIIGIIPSLVSIYVMNGFHGTEPFIVRIDSCLIAFSFVLIGYHLWDFDALQYIKMTMSHFSDGSIVIFLCLLFGISFPLVYNNSYVNICDAALGKSEVLFYYLALLGSFYCIVLACKIAKTKNAVGLYIKNKIVTLGKHSLFFYFGHGIIFQMYHKCLLGGGVKIGGQWLTHGEYA